MERVSARNEGIRSILAERPSFFQQAENPIASFNKIALTIVSEQPGPFSCVLIAHIIILCGRTSVLA